MIRRQHVRGFTIIEVLVVITVVGIFAAWRSQFSAYMDKAKITDAMADLKTLQVAIELLAIDTNRWPGPSAVGVTAN